MAEVMPLFKKYLDTERATKEWSPPNGVFQVFMTGYVF